jgi:hypothetical protein
MRRLILLAPLLLAPVLHAQLAEAYGTLAINHENVQLRPYTEAASSAYTPVGGTFGGTFNFVPLKLLTIGIDGRETVASGANFWLAGIQIKVKPPVLPIKPFFRISVGEEHLHVPQSYSTTIPNPAPIDYYIYNAALGVDYRLRHFVDLRLVEIGDGRTLGGGSTNPTSLLTVSTGIVVHF